MTASVSDPYTLDEVIALARLRVRGLRKGPPISGRVESEADWDVIQQWKAIAVIAIETRALKEQINAQRQDG